MFKKNSGVIVAGLALFSMFFGAGDLIWPLILGGETGDKNFYSLLGLLITGVGLPLLGLIAIVLFQGDYRAFFGQTGKRTGIVLVFVIQAILGPFGSIPRLITLSYATLKPYMPEMVSLAIFSILACALIFLFTIKRHRVIDILGIILTPLLLIALGAILFLGFKDHPAPHFVDVTDGKAFFRGLTVGYNTLDLIASFIFASLVLSYFKPDATAKDQVAARREVFKKMIKSCFFAALLLGGMYVGLTYVSSYYTQHLPSGHLPEERLGHISLHLLGPQGALLSCIAVALSCLTTAIPISLLSADYIHKDLMNKRGKHTTAIIVALGLSAAVANLGFMGIASMLSPILQIICPGLIILAVLSILHKLYEMRIRRSPVYVAFAISLAAFIFRVV